MSLEGQMLAKFSGEHGLCLKSLSGEPFGEGEFSFRRDPYSFRVGEDYFSKEMVSPVKITHAYIRWAARFSNSLIQLSNAISFSTHNGVGSIVLPNFWYVRPGISVVNDIEVNNIPKDELPEVGARDLLLDGNYFYRHSLAGMYDQKSHFENLSSVKSIFCFDYDVSPFDASDLVIHIRSGDVFVGDGANAGYGQPPLAFYKHVINKENPELVHLVFEDLRNPVINSLIEYLVGSKIQVKLVSSSLRDDINYLLRARVLVTGRGTFIPGVTAISDNIEKVYYFESGYNSWGNPNIECVKVSDLKGDYKEEVLKYWKNSDLQRRKMLEYSEEFVG